jgi:hypothetical protein
MCLLKLLFVNYNPANFLQERSMRSAIIGIWVKLSVIVILIILALLLLPSLQSALGV